MHKRTYIILFTFLIFLSLGTFYFSKIVGIFGVFFVAIGDVLKIIFSNPLGITDVAMRVWSLFLYGFGIKKRHRHPWGTVYDSETKQPIHGAKLVLMDVENKIFATSITDDDGRYGFLVEPGMYHILAQKKGYAFPSNMLFGKGSDVVYNDLYFGNFLEIKKYGEVITKNIPMLRLNFNWTEFSKNEQKKFKFYHIGDKSIGQIINVAFVVGFATSVLSLFGASVKTYDVIIVGIYILMFLANRTKFGKNAKGTVFFKDTNLPVAYGILRVKSISEDKEIAHSVIDHIGNYYCLAPDGSYLVTIEQKNSDGSYTKIYEEKDVVASKGYINKNFKI